MSKTGSLIIERDKIELTDSQSRMINSGWGEGIINSTIVEKITYLSNGLKVKGYVAYPGDTSKKYPCIIWNRGGIGDRGVIDSFTARGLFGQLASWGYVVFASQYRGNDGAAKVKMNLATMTLMMY
jgi:dipeptidyl aminopeptidase/acylaminoacyl peptidase